VIASGSNRVDERRVGARFGQEIERADPDFVRSSTGYAIGGVPPVAHRAPIVTLIDADLLPLPVVWAAAGTPHAVFSVTPDDLVAATGGEVVDVARR
jgi:prolyl-tRNA editing enzyme YbaK/EbsC (Cys-tRNA(Pro) deacylase)